MALLSIVSPFLNESESAGEFAAFVKKLGAALKESFDVDLEVILVDDGSTDDGVARFRDVLEGQWRIVELSRNFGKEIALFAGIEESTGDYVMMIDADLQHPYDVCIQMISTLLADPDLDVVYSIRDDRGEESWRKALGGRLFYRLINASQRFVIPENAGDFRVMRRNAANALLTVRDKRRFNKGLYAWTGFRQASVYYTPDARSAGATKWSKLGLLALSLEGITSFSAIPLRVVSILGAATGFMGVLYGLKILFEVLFYGIEVPGYPSLMVAISVLGGFNLALLGMLGEYLWVAVAEAKDRPLYIVRRLHSPGGNP